MRRVKCLIINGNSHVETWTWHDDIEVLVRVLALPHPYSICDTISSRRRVFQQLWNYRSFITASSPWNPDSFFMALDGGTGSKLGHVAIIVAGYISLIQLIQPGLTFARGFSFFPFWSACSLTATLLAFLWVLSTFLYLYSDRLHQLTASLQNL